MVSTNDVYLILLILNLICKYYFDSFIITVYCMFLADIQTSNNHRDYSDSRHISSQHGNTPRSSQFSGTEMSDMSSIGIEERNRERAKDIKQEKSNGVTMCNLIIAKFSRSNNQYC